MMSEYQTLDISRLSHRQTSKEVALITIVRHICQLTGVLVPMCCDTLFINKSTFRNLIHAIVINNNMN